MPAPLVKQNAGNSLDLVDIKEIRGNIVVMKDGSLRQIVMVGGVNFALNQKRNRRSLSRHTKIF